MIMQPRTKTRSTRTKSKNRGKENDGLKSQSKASKVSVKNTRRAVSSTSKISKPKPQMTKSKKRGLIDAGIERGDRQELKFLKMVDTKATVKKELP